MSVLDTVLAIAAGVLALASGLLGFGLRKERGRRKEAEDETERGEERLRTLLAVQRKVRDAAGEGRPEAVPAPSDDAGRLGRLNGVRDGGDGG